MRSRFNAAPSRLPAPEDGIVTTGRSGGWIAKRWFERLANLDRSHGPRLLRGRNFARKGRVRALWFSPGLASAQVVAEEHYSVSLRMRVFTDAEWKRVIDVLLENLLNIASLLEGELPQPLFDRLEASGISLIPTLDEITGDCDCDDYMTPCAHMAAVHNVLAEAVDGEPFLLLSLRGRPRAQMLTDIRKAWGDTSVKRPLSAEEPPPEPGGWLRSPHPLPAYDFRFHESENAAAGLKALGPAPGHVDLERALGPLYEAGAAAALRMALEDGPSVADDDERVRQFRRSVQRPTQASAGSEATELTERVVDALAEVQCAKSKELAERIGANALDVRRELLELEKLGIVYRTGQTRGTRWWLG